MGGALTNVGIIHSHRLFRDAFVVALTNQERITVGWEAPCVEQLQLNGEEPQPDLFLVEASDSLERCCEEVGRLRLMAPECKVIMMGVPETDEAVLDCIERVGASGYVLESGSLHDVVRNIRSVAAGETVCSPRVAGLVFSRVSELSRQVSSSWINRPDKLTRREEEIVTAIECGCSNKEIAVRLGIEVSTVKNHVHNILDKLQLRDRRSAAEYAKQQGLVGSRH